MLHDFKSFNEGNLNAPGEAEHVLNAELLHYDTESKTFSTEVSDLGRSFNPIYKNNNEMIVIKNIKTGKFGEYWKTEDKRDGENELMYTIYKPKPGTTGYGTQLLIFND